MSHTNSLVSFLRHYGPIPTGDNMYDELIQAEIERHGIDPAIEIDPVRLAAVKECFESAEPSNVILTGTAGDGKTYHCRAVWEHFGGSPGDWNAGKKIARLTLPESGKLLTVVKDLSELTVAEKIPLFTDLTSAVTDAGHESVFLVAANDGQLLASWRDWSESQYGAPDDVFRAVESMLVDGLTTHSSLRLLLYNLSRLDASEHFQELADRVVEHPQWEQCHGCELLNDNEETTCPIRINRERLRNSTRESVFRQRLGDLMKLARANGMHLPIRDLLLLLVNILLGDRQGQQVLLSCRTAKNRAKAFDYRLTNPYANVFGMNLLPERKRNQYQVFVTLGAFGIGRETDNRFDNLLVYDTYAGSGQHTALVPDDPYYGSKAYERLLRDYLEGEREDIKEFLQALSRQRQRLFFSLPPNEVLDPWHLTVFQTSGEFLGFVDGLKHRKDVSRTVETLVRGLNRTFCGMMIDQGTRLYLASSGGDGRGRVASLLSFDLPTKISRRDPYVNFSLTEEQSTPCLQVVDPDRGGARIIDTLILQLTHFEYLMRVARGSLPSSFSRQCYEDFIDFKLRLVSRLDKLIGDVAAENEVSLLALTVDAQGRANKEEISIRVGS